MKRTFVYVENFDQNWKKYGLGATEQRELELQLLMDPGQGDVITGTGGNIIFTSTGTKITVATVK